MIVAVKTRKGIVRLLDQRILKKFRAFVSCISAQKSDMRGRRVSGGNVGVTVSVTVSVAGIFNVINNAH